MNPPNQAVTAAGGYSHAEALDVWDLPWVVEPHPRSGQRCVKSRRAFAVGEILTSLRAATIEERPTRMTVQVSESTHVTLDPPSLAYINHACSPNVHFEVVRGLVVVIRPIAVGDEIAFFYPSTEWAMVAPFDCHCGAARCLGRVAGASQVPAGALLGRPLAPHVRRLLGSWDRSAVSP
jgi:hypothetical protein